MEKHGLHQPELKNGEYRPRVMAYYFKQWEQFSMKFHAHNSVEFMYVLSGTCMVEVETAGQAIPMRKGELIVVDALVPHRLVVEESCRMLNIEFQFQPKQAGIGSVGELIRSNEELQRLSVRPFEYLMLRDDGEVYPALRSLVLELDRVSGGSQAMTDLLLYRLLLLVARLADNPGEDEARTTAQLYVKRALEYMHSHYDGDLQMKDIAAAVNLHPGYLHRLFRRGQGCTVMDYLTRYRIDKARMLLAHSDIPVIEIADYVGMNSRQHFSTVFKKITGVTPQQYRKSAALSSGWEGHKDV
ncbi:MAG: AraC family transcriptional regulator [Paenibacillaceae bacterium]|jgi:AraC-like DNA-binding protein/mannose-6-phosphate isomerase-like protein (cupin superfamily)|nr:AraC family transcriptional regulator [Paenibacillaceae bacterium]